MHEATKTIRFLGRQFVDRYLSGAVLDIGCGPDLVVPHAKPFDMKDGDANRIGDYLPAESFDCVHSSHCLEHMHNAPAALQQWWSLVKPGGFLIVNVPHEDLYEQGIWPSIFNPDHKGTFRLDKPTSWSPVSHDMRNIVGQLPGAEIIEASVQDVGYDYRWKGNGLHVPGKIAFKLGKWRKDIFKRLGFTTPALDRLERRIAFHLGRPFDQTEGNALAQIQVVARKSAA